MSCKLLSQVVLVLSLVAIVQRVSIAAPSPASKRFDIDYAIQLFEDSMADKEAIPLQLYLNGLRELIKFFRGLGTMYSFAATDLETHMGLLQKYHDTVKVDGKPAYLTIQSAIDYEREAYKSKLANHPTGIPAFRWSHRALEFVYALMANLSVLSYDAEAGPAVRKAYEDTLAKHHPWAIKTIASLVMRALPTKRALAESALGKGLPIDEEVINGKALRLANATRDLFLAMKEIFQEKIKDLP